MNFWNAPYNNTIKTYFILIWQKEKAGKTEYVVLLMRLGGMGDLGKEKRRKITTKCIVNLCKYFSKKSS